MTTHLAQSRREVEQVEKRYGETPTQHLIDLGILDDRLTAAHCTYATEQDTRLIASSGTGILHCRATTNPLTRWIELGIPIGLGTDDYHHDMLTLLRQNLIGQRTRARQERASGGTGTDPLSYYDFLELSTRRGAEALGIDNDVGSLEPGKKADIITFNMLNPYLTPTKDPLTSIVLYGAGADIDTVIVDGKILKKDGELTTVDIEQALLTAQERVEKIISRFFQEHPKQKARWEEKVPYMK
jgi:5-methylthioadenosine/S-adenosylhomocysteine deaminase